MKHLILVFTLLHSIMIMAKSAEKLPYNEIPIYTEAYSANLVAARMVDGLGFRYYWATEALRHEDLIYKPSESGRATIETIEHIYGLSKMIRNSVLPHVKDVNNENTDTAFKLQDSTLPFWNIINGPISDALWHCGQVAMLRRSSGNPFNSKVNLFSGTVKE